MTLICGFPSIENLEIFDTAFFLCGLVDKDRLALTWRYIVQRHKQVGKAVQQHWERHHTDQQRTDISDRMAGQCTRTNLERDIWKKCCCQEEGDKDQGTAWWIIWRVRVMASFVQLVLYHLHAWEFSDIYSSSI